MSRYGSMCEDEFLDNEIEIVKCIRRIRRQGEVMD